MRTALRIVVVAFALVLVGPLRIATDRPAGALQIEPIDEEPVADAPGLGSIIGSPDAGPDPEDPGDRGGWAQLVLAVVLAGGVAFIMTRVIRAARAAK